MEEESERYNKVFPKRFNAFLRHFCKKDTRKRSRFRGGKGGKRRDLYPILRLFRDAFFFFVVCSNSRKKKIFLEREREDLNAVIMMERT